MILTKFIWDSTYNVPFIIFSHSRFLKYDGLGFPKQPSISFHGDLEEPENVIASIQSKEFWMIEEDTELAYGVKWLFSKSFHFYLLKVNPLSNKTLRSLEREGSKEHLMRLKHQQTFVDLKWVMLGFSELKFQSTVFGVKPG